MRALVLYNENGTIQPRIETLPEDRLPEGDLLLEVHYSSLNYKDALAVTGRGKIIRGEYPFVPGIDLVGTVLESENPDIKPGQTVIVTGWGIGETHWGGYATRARVRSEWVVPLPRRLTPLEAMAIGTAGFTAMLSVMALEEHGLIPDQGEVVVTGASGGVGSLAVAILAHLGYDVVASTGKTSAYGLLQALGAARVIDRQELGQGPKRPLDSGLWAGAVDTVGGPTLAALLSQLKRHGSVAACGLAQSHEFTTTVFPFILRGINLLGIDSNTCPQERRRRAWHRLTHDLPKDALHRVTRVIPLSEVPQWSEAMLAGKTQGRLVVDVQT
ncbi:MDR family oxidoreductase [Rhodothermus marinus]|uniref:Quinone oxidoreductase, YhdH/YhfP family n=1 Tax=Rhodothermus marinus (strain ATCC 43812 / DSM 4252 / R-10) TaxID=518766 RepID=D0MIJ8_RHOM4|nr:MDR family oxidoreductase [Rhodothermus marinus]ACY48306.1 quinone oxidoreductase, YhdH/YhfP family [Rhodothermus marinus DSM 4252]